MLAINHAVTGAIIGLSVGNPALGLPLAFASHFALDAIPHYDLPGEEAERVGSGRFKLQLLADASVCGLLVLGLALAGPKHWLTAAVCAFVATSPDLLWIPKFVFVLRNHKLPATQNAFLRFHNSLPWRTGPKLIWVELVWLVATGTLLLTKVS